MTPEALQVLRDHANALNRNTAAIEIQNRIREAELKSRTADQRRERSRYKEWLYADEVVGKLRPFVSETQTLKLIRERGLIGSVNEGYHQKGRAFFYNPIAVDKLLKQFNTGQQEPLKRK